MINYTFERSFFDVGEETPLPPQPPQNVFQFWENVTRHGNITFLKIQERKGM
jgi:hypothetical protein